MTRPIKVRDGYSSIYALVDPFTLDIRYIGKSEDPVRRLRDHINDRSRNHRTNWIRSLKARGAEPELIILQTLIPGTNWQLKEQQWIAWGKFVGWPLTNSTDGGDGVSGLPEEVRERMRKTWVGRKHRPESIEKIGAASRGRKCSEERKEKVRAKMLGREITWGDKISNAVRKLTDDQVREIRTLLSQGFTQVKIAQRFGVDPTTISNIKNGRFYSEVQ